MSHEEIIGLLDDFLDGALEAETALEVERHLAECDACRAEAESLRALLERASSLPRGIEPPRDLWPEIDSTLGRTRFSDRSIWSLRYPLAAAAVILIAVSSLITRELTLERSATTPSDAIGSGVGATSLVALRWSEIEGEYLRATAELMEALEATREVLAPATWETLDYNLRIIDGAIQETRAALAGDPGSRELMEMLSATYQKKIDVLQQMTRL